MKEKPKVLTADYRRYPDEWKEIAPAVQSMEQSGINPAFAIRQAFREWLVKRGFLKEKGKS